MLCYGKGLEYVCIRKDPSPSARLLDTLYSLKYLVLCPVWKAMRYSFAFPFLAISYFSICPSPQAARHLAIHILLQMYIDIILVYCLIVLTGRCELTRVTRRACMTATVTFSDSSLFLSRHLWSSLPYKRPCSNRFLLWLSTKSKPRTSTTDAVSESIQFSSLFARALGIMTAPRGTGCACKFFADKEHALQLLLLIHRHWELHSVLKKSRFCMQKHNNQE